ncbi:hypothetical protein I5192_11275 [Ruegeria sp. SCSIO 43209]|uniref:hypothetical protein n=1 Tax=Ruegeria sp. SCSIO 43209 TaxID=2793010 RepID=UPI001CA9F7D1|nr:hypothetical protein [Ruegeria sp. SCSIO 43209]UAB87821.1 hypothetical protein I5192_11275 [Ruegeria sp. SCSIO 43209]
MNELIPVLRETLLVCVCFTVTIIGSVAFANNDFEIADSHKQNGVSIASKASEFKHNNCRFHSTTDQDCADDCVSCGGACHTGTCCVGENPTQLGLAVLVEAYGQRNRNMDTDNQNSQAPLTPNLPPQIS